MRYRFYARTFLALLALLVALPASFGWGENAQRVIADKAVDTLPDEMSPFFYANRQFIVQHVHDPAGSETKNPAERRNSFIELDHYGTFPFTALPRVYTEAMKKYGRHTLEAHGQLPWEIGLYSQKLTDAFRAHNWDDAKLAAAFLAYYVACAHDPFKSTVNNDGTLSLQPGVNERFGTGLVDRYQRFFFTRPNEATFIKDPTDYAFEMSLSAHAWLESILLADRRALAGLPGYNDEYFDRFYSQEGAVLIRQFSEASADVGSYWMTAWINAGRPQLPNY
jgi:hypothetical protein